MYHPYFRGKQFELITIREMAPLLAENDFVPIIEPVREALGGLKKTLKAVCDAGGKAIVIVNPTMAIIRKTAPALAASFKKALSATMPSPPASCCAAT